MDDPYVSCPYDKLHRVPRSRLQRHIVKCEAKYPKLAICPYNATHRFSDEEMKLHILTCPSKVDVYSGIKPNIVSVGALTVPRPINQKEYLSENDPEYEIWDD